MVHARVNKLCRVRAGAAASATRGCPRRREWAVPPIATVGARADDTRMHALLALYVFALVTLMSTALLAAYLLPPDEDL